MIHVPRARGWPRLRVFTQVTRQSRWGPGRVTAAKFDRQKAIDFFADPKNYAGDRKITKKETPTFTAYKHPEVVDELMKLFRRKCAYCESTFKEVANQDVEHFRPKAAIETGELDTETKKRKELMPGYYWLVADWHNLLLSCQHCNRSQRHETPGHEKKVKMGKGTQFPLTDENRRVRDPRTPIRREEPYRLLVQPCADNDAERQFSWTEDGLVRPESKRGEVSIDIYALQRKDLVERREEEARELKLQVATVRDAAQDLLEAIEERKTSRIARKERQLTREMDRLLARLGPASRYLALKRELIRDKMAAGSFDDLRELKVGLPDLLNLTP